jgi:hypothetical protein
VLNKLVVSLVGMTVTFTAAIVVRADQLPSGPSDGSIGFWSVAPLPTGGASNAGTVVSLYDSGQMSAFSLGAWTTPGSQDAGANQINGGGLVIGGTADATTTFTINPSDSNGNSLSSAGPFPELIWAPNAVNLQSGTGPVVFTWTALSDGSYMVNASVSPSGSSGSPTISGPSGSSPFSEVISFKAGDTISFISSPTGLINHLTADSGFDVNLSPFQAGTGGPGPPDPVPEPSRLVALAGIGLMGLFGGAWTFWRQRKSSAAICGC